MTQSTPPTDAVVADWMLQQLKKDGVLYQRDAAADIESKFGSAFVYTNDNGNTAIGAGVLKAFRKLTHPGVVWESGERMWRFREKFDDPKKRKAD
jgi:hypothetical protein